MHGSTNGTAAIESPERDSGQAWVIDARARVGGLIALFAKTVWQTCRGSNELRDINHDSPFVWVGGRPFGAVRI